MSELSISIQVYNLNKHNAQRFFKVLVHKLQTEIKKSYMELTGMWQHTFFQPISPLNKTSTILIII